MTIEQKAAAILLDDEEVMLGPREIENPLANNLGLGVLVGMWVAPARLLNDPDYQRWVPTMGGLPIHVLDSETLFPPVSTEI
ncbi:hypothetical protein [Devosia sp.]|uniref:hypothetical protein n=1 Tax=Devosia sp. TaxID=1871048 RepID=UPI002AFE8A2A|nr:hypothetical protein [Devosia sp.]